MVQVNLSRNILSANDLLAQKNRELFASNGNLVINMMSSPGSGKTTILEKTLGKIKSQMVVGVIEGDLYTDQDACRLKQPDVSVIQINTEGGCHLDAKMVEKAYQDIIQNDQNDINIVFIENVGNLVCPAEFDLGEDKRVVVLSVAEGNDKPLKYPLVFRQADAVLVNKIDLLPYTDFNMEKFRQDLIQLNPGVRVFEMSARTGKGIEKWCQWLREEFEKKQG